MWYFLAHMPDLTKLYLRNCDISSDVFIQLKNEMRLKKLKILDISENPLDKKNELFSKLKNENKGSSHNKYNRFEDTSSNCKSIVSFQGTEKSTIVGFENPLVKTMVDEETKDAEKGTVKMRSIDEKKCVAIETLWVDKCNLQNSDVEGILYAVKEGKMIVEKMYARNNKFSAINQNIAQTTVII